MKKPIQWTLIQVNPNQLKPNPNNPKKRNEAGFKRLQKSLEKFGRVFDGIVNSDMTIIDGHSRLETAKEGEKLRVFKPSRKLSVSEYKEMNAIFDLSKAGDIDTQILEDQFTEEFFDEWEMTESRKALKKNISSPNIETLFLLNIELSNEKELESLYEELSARGLKIKIIQ